MKEGDPLCLTHPSRRPSPPRPRRSWRTASSPAPTTAPSANAISAALADGYVLHGNPSATYNGSTVIVAQAVVLPAAIASADAAVADAVDELDERGSEDAGYDEAFEGHA